MAHYPSIHLLISRAEPDYLILQSANSQMRIANMSEEERREVLKELALSKDKRAKAQELFSIEVI